MQVPFSISPLWLRRARWFVGSLLVLWLLAWLAVPPLVKRMVEEKGSQALGRAVTVGDVAFRPWSLELIVSDVAVATADGKARQLEMARVYVDAELESVLRLAPVMDAITIDAPTLRIAHLGDGHYDIDDIIATLSKAPLSTSAPLQFALYNLTLNGGAVDFTDHTPTGVRQHSLRALHLAVPFLSTLESKRTVKVVPRLAFTLNGSAFDTAAEGTPFAQTNKGDATLKIVHLDLAPYLPYLPSSLPVRLKSAVVDADLRLAFEQAKQPKLTLTGKLKLSGLVLTDATGAPLLAVESIAAELADVRPLERVVQLASLEINAPQLQAARSRAGRLNLALGGSSPSAKGEQVAINTVAAHASVTGAGSKKYIKASAVEHPWALSLERFVLHRGEVAWADDSTTLPARLTLAQLELQAHGLQWPLSPSAARFEGSANVPSKGKAAQLAFKGEAAEALSSIHASVGDAELALAAPYLAQFLVPGVQGVLDAEMDATWAADKQGDKLLLALPRLTVRDFVLKAAKAPVAKELASVGNAPGASGAEDPTGAERAAAEMPRFKLLEVTGAQLDLTARTGTAAKVALRSPSAMLNRDTRGQWIVQRWLKAAPTSTVSTPYIAKAAEAASSITDASSAPGHPAAANKAATPDWQISLGELVVDNGTIKLDDRSMAHPARLEVSALKLQLKTATLDGSKPVPLTLSARIKSGRTEPGTLNYRGTVAWAPMAAQGTVEAVDIPLHALAPYFADQLNIAILRADAGFKGQLRYVAATAGPEVQLQGDASVEDFRANTVVGSPSAGGPAADNSAGIAVDVPDLGVTEELLSWKALKVLGIALNLAPGTAPRVQVREATLSDFFARVIVNATGRVNLQDLVKIPQTTGGEHAATGAPMVAASTPVSAGASAAASATLAPPAAAPLAAIVSMGPIRLVNGKVLFSDRFIRPNYSADLSELNGTLSQFSSLAKDGVVQLADLELRGRAEGTASLEIAGKVNPLAKPLALDIKGHVRDLDLPPLTAYSVKYAGYGIERGKLSMDVTYTVLPNGQLTASNKLVLNQLTFGDEVKGAPNSLPVKLAVALLADSNGVIDIELPISGSVNDPQFSFGALAWKVVTNLIGKALTSPFGLLARAMGGGGGVDDESSTVVFAPGSSVLSPSATQSLDGIAKALSVRPALNVTVVGTASLEMEGDAFKRERLKTLMQGEKRRLAIVTGQDGVAGCTLTDAEYAVLLKDVYRRADIAKPRNFVGLAKDIPDAQMEALLLASIPANDDAMRTLALQRGVVVKDYLVSRKLPPERLFVGAAKTVMADADWKPRAELGVAQR